MLPWTFFANAVSTAAQSVVVNQNLVTKVYFPRMIIPIGAVAATMVDFLVALGMLAILMLYYRVVPGWHCVFATLPLLGLIAAALGVGAWLRH